MIARTKYQALGEVGKKLGAAASKILKQRMEAMPTGTRSGLNELQANLAKVALPSIKLSAPLLPANILRVARENGCSVIQAVNILRDDPSAPAFREFVWEARKGLDPLRAGDHLAAAETKRKLKELGQRIAKAGSSGGARYDVKTIRVSSSRIPYVGHVLKALNLDFKFEREIHIPRHAEQYELFMADWFA